jgi:protein SCO1/2
MKPATPVAQTALVGRLAGAALFALLAAAQFFVSSAAEARRWGRDYLPNVPVVTQDGKTLAFYDDVIKDKLVVISFLYTSCRDVCPLTAARLAQVQDRLGDKLGRDVFFVSVSIDPETDTPALLKAQADALRARPGWLFLTGKREDIDAIRYKLGERSRSLTEHRNEVLFGNDRTGEWARESVFGDLMRFEHSLRQMDPSLRDDSPVMGSAEGAGINAVISGTPGQGLFNKACGSCHTVGHGDRIGPDLHGVTARRDAEWLKKFIIDPERMRSQKDPIALELAAARPGLRMPNLGLSKVDAEDLLVFLATASAAVPKARPVEPVAAPAPAPVTASPLKTLVGLTTHQGQALAAADVEGRPIGVVFGFTHCPDVCPTTLLDWSNLLETLGADADKLKLYFVSVDSERDTPAALKAYMQSFDPRITALTGTPDAIAKAAAAFDAHYEKVDTGSDYVYDHTIKTFMFDARGQRAGGVDLNTATLDRRELLAKLLH